MLPASVAEASAALAVAEAFTVVVEASTVAAAAVAEGKTTFLFEPLKRRLPANYIPLLSKRTDTALNLIAETQNAFNRQKGLKRPLPGTRVRSSAIYGFFQQSARTLSPAMLSNSGA